jgi:DNA-binding transcriptional regulator YdaS (Cro superfamily)
MSRTAVIRLVSKAVTLAGSQRKLAAKLKCHPGMVSRWARGARAPSNGYLDKIGKLIEKAA